MRKTTIITTTRLRLRTWLSSDVAAFDTHCNTDAVMRYLGGTTARSALRREVRWYQQDHARHGHTFWVVERKYDNALLGFCGIIRVPERGSPLRDKLEIGWRIRTDKWRRGYAYEAAAAVLEWAGWELDDEYVYARVDHDNEASQRLARKLGMRRDRVMERKQRRDDDTLWVFRCRPWAERPIT